MSGSALSEPRVYWFPDEPVMSVFDWDPRNTPTRVIEGPSPGVVVQVGEIVVIEGDEEIVTDLGGGFGIDPFGQLPLIGQRFYSMFPDEFDGLAFFTSFEDASNGGAYSVAAGWDGIDGIGVGLPGSGAGSYGSQGRLISVINMNSVGFWGSMQQPGNFFHAVFGQELTHTWLAFLNFRDPMTGVASTDLLGRQQAHWSAIVNSAGSVQDGIEWIDNGDGSFTAGEFMVRYGPLDLYSMGVISPQEFDEDDVFIIRDARYPSGDPVGLLDVSAGIIGPGVTITGERVDLAVADLEAVAGQGPRNPAWDAEEEHYRIAWILVTAPGETVDDVMPQITALEDGRRIWEQTHQEWTFNRSTMCTQVSRPCPTALATVAGGEVAEDPDDSDGDGIIEPHESALLTVSFFNPGTEDATGARASFSGGGGALLLPDDVDVPVVPAGAEVEATYRFAIRPEACGREVTLSLDSKLGETVWNREFSFKPGEMPPGPAETFETDAGWMADSRNVSFGGFAHEIPVHTEFGNTELQPAGGADGRNDPAWFTGPIQGFSQGEVVGEAVVISSPIALSDVYGGRLRYDLWYVALDRSPTGELTPSPETHLIIDASTDGGQSWTEMDRVVSAAPVRWEPREIQLDSFPAASEVQIRFKAIDYEAWQVRFLEVGIDNVRIASLSPQCDPAFMPAEEEEVDTGGCAIALAAGAPAGGAGSAGLHALLAQAG